MSIAVSALIRPSRRLRAVLAIYAALNLAAALLVLGADARAFGARHAVAAGCVLAALGAARACARSGKVHPIDVSGLGEVRLTVQRNTGGADRESTLASLLPGSTVWPRLMLLLLRSEAGKTAPVLVMADSLDAEQFRALAVAVRAIGAKNAVREQDFFGLHKIL